MVLILALNTGKRKDLGLYMTLAGSLVISIIGFYYYLQPVLGRMEKTHDMLNFFFSTFYWKNPAAAYLMLFIPVVFFSMLTEVKIKNKISFSVLFVIISTAFLLTRSRASFISLAVSVLFSALLFKLSTGTCPIFLGLSRKKILFIFIPLFIVAGLTILLLPPKNERVRADISTTLQNEPQERSLSERKLMLDMAFNVISENPQGVGLGSFILAYPRYLKSSYYLSRHLHNQYLQYATETGILGGVLFILFACALYFELFKRVLKSLTCSSSF
jgi:O-antigen ligase